MRMAMLRLQSRNKSSASIDRQVSAGLVTYSIGTPPEVRFSVDGHRSGRFLVFAKATGTAPATLKLSESTLEPVETISEKASTLERAVYLAVPHIDLTPSGFPAPSGRDRVRDLVRYLISISQGDPEQRLITPRMARLALRAWALFWAGTHYRLPTPDACPGPSGDILYTWDRESHHFELEVFPEGPAELFYANRATGELWGCDYIPGQPISEEVRSKLRLFV
jgi:hypothetical protein